MKTAAGLLCSLGYFLTGLVALFALTDVSHISTGLSFPFETAVVMVLVAISFELLGIFILLQSHLDKKENQK